MVRLNVWLLWGVSLLASFACRTAVPDTPITPASPTVVAYQLPTRTPTIPAPRSSPGPIPTPPRPSLPPQPTSDRTPVPTSTNVIHPASQTEAAHARACRTPLPLSDTWTTYRASQAAIRFEYPSSWGLFEFREIVGTSVRVGNQLADCSGLNPPPAIMFVIVSAWPLQPDDPPIAPPRWEDAQYFVRQRTITIQGVTTTMNYALYPGQRLPFITAGQDVAGYRVSFRGFQIPPHLEWVLDRVIESFRIK